MDTVQPIGFYFMYSFSGNPAICVRGIPSFTQGASQLLYLPLCKIE